MSEQPIIVEYPRPEIVLVRLNRPERMNALTLELLAELRATIEDAERNETRRVVILTGNGRGFCAGADLHAALQRQEEPVPNRMRSQEIFAGTARLMRDIGIPVIAAVNGACVGAGFGIALSTDIRIASKSASFHIGAIRRGLAAGESSISYHLPRAIGSTSRAFELLLTGRPVDAQEAERLGIVSRTVDDDQLLNTALQIAEEIISNTRFGVARTKNVMWRNLDNSFESAIDLENMTQLTVISTGSAKDAFRTFTEKA